VVDVEWSTRRCPDVEVTEVTGCQAKTKDEYKRKRRPKRKCGCGNVCLLMLWRKGGEDL